MGLNRAIEVFDLVTAPTEYGLQAVYHPLNRYPLRRYKSRNRVHREEDVRGDSRCAHVLGGTVNGLERKGFHKRKQPLQQGRGR